MPTIDKYFVELSATTDKLKRDLDAATGMVRKAAGDQNALAAATGQGMAQIGLAATVAGEKIDGGMRRSRESIRDAKDSAELFGDAIGVRLPRELNKFLASSSAIGPMLAGAFNVAIVAGFAAAIYEVGKKAWESFNKVDEGAAKAHEAFLKLNNDLDNQITKQQRQLELYGLIGAARAYTEEKFTVEDLAAADKKVKLLQDRVDELNRIIAEGTFKTMSGQYGVPVTALSPQAAAAQKELNAKNKEGINLEQQLAIAIKERTIATNALAESNRKFADAQAEDAKKVLDASTKLTEEIKKLDIELYHHTEAWRLDLAAQLETSGVMESWLPTIEEINAKLKAQQDALASVSDTIRNELIPSALAVPEWLTKGAAPETGPIDSAIVAEIKAAGDAAERVGAAARKSVDQVRQAVDTTFSDMERGIAESIIHWKGFGETVKSIFQDLGTALLRIFEQKLFLPLENWFSGFLNKIMGGRSSSAGGIGALAGIGSGSWFGSLAGPVGLGATAGMGLGGLFGGGATGTGLGALVGGLGGLGIAGGFSALGTGALTGGVIGTGAGGFMSGMAAMMTNPITIAVAGALAATLLGIKFATGKNAYQAGAPEAMRDFGVNLSQDAFKQFTTGLGLSEPQTYPIRKELLSSPLAITQLLGPIAQANGQMDQFLKRLESVSTSWGTFNLRTAYEAGLASGDFAELNKTWDETIGKSTTLAQIMPDFAVKLAAVASATTALDAVTQAQIDGFNELKAAIQGAIIPLETMYQHFLNTGEVTDALADKLKELGGNLEAFQKYADLSKQLGPLQAQLDFITQLKNAVAALAPELDPIKALLSGSMSPSVLAALTQAGIEPGKLTGLTSMIGMESGWQKAVQAFQSAGQLSPELKQALLQFGGQPGQVAVERFGAGFNTITSTLLEATKQAMDTAYQKQITSALDYLGTLQEQTVNAVKSLQESISDAAAAVVSEIDLMISKLSTPAASTVTTGGSGPAPGPSVYIDMRDSTIYGYDDFEKRINDAVGANYERHGVQFLT